MSRTKFGLFATLLLGTAAPAWAGPPYLTDDPAPTDLRQWEIYSFIADEGIGSTQDADAGFDLNYGAAEGVQLTATLPMSFSRNKPEGWRSGAGGVEVAVKYRFLNDEEHGVSAAIFPRVILPTSSLEDGGKTRILLPVWIEKDFAGGTSLFGGGGYELNPGAGNRNFWQAGVALTHDVSKTLSLGAEVTRQGSDTDDATVQTRAGAGAIAKLSDHVSLLFSGGPTWEDHQTGYHAYGALGFFF
jgi:hypothetical protein